MTRLRSDLPPVPRRMQTLPIDERGYPVPWFVDRLDGRPIFQAMDPQKHRRALQHRLCWLCGEPLGRYGIFVVGPMCGISRISAEPPCHLDCAEFAVKACPFLTRPLATRSPIPGETAAIEPVGMIKRNPGVTLLWATKQWQAYRTGHSVLVEFGDPEHVTFYREGRAAAFDEVKQSIATGLPILESLARKQGEAAVAELQRDLKRFAPILAVAFAARELAQ